MKNVHILDLISRVHASSSSLSISSFSSCPTRVTPSPKSRRNRTHGYCPPLHIYIFLSFPVLLAVVALISAYLNFFFLFSHCCVLVAAAVVVGLSLFASGLDVI